MIVGLQEEFSVPVVMSLTILGAETSLGDPRLGGESAKNHNYGCLKYMGPDTPWGALSSGKAVIKGTEWYVFPDAATGIRAWGIYISQGPTWSPGLYLRAYPQWEDIAAVYYGKAIEDYHVYLGNLEKLAAKFSSGLRAAGFNV
jgi:hypothetical protein